jgi:hypothetical protein
MKTVWKFPLADVALQIVRVPKGAQALTAQAQGARFAQLCLWALVDTKNADNLVDMQIYIHGTGREVWREARKGRYLSTVQMEDGAHVSHVFVGEVF